MTFAQALLVFVQSSTHVYNSPIPYPWLCVSVQWWCIYTLHSSCHLLIRANISLIDVADLLVFPSRTTRQVLLAELPHYCALCQSDGNALIKVSIMIARIRKCKDETQSTTVEADVPEARRKDILTCQARRT